MSKMIDCPLCKGESTLYEGKEIRRCVNCMKDVPVDEWNEDMEDEE